MTGVWARSGKPAWRKGPLGGDLKGTGSQKVKKGGQARPSPHPQPSLFRRYAGKPQQACCTARQAVPRSQPCPSSLSSSGEKPVWFLVTREVLQVLSFPLLLGLCP